MAEMFGQTIPIVLILLAMLVGQVRTPAFTKIVASASQQILIKDQGYLHRSRSRLTAALQECSIVRRRGPRGGGDVREPPRRRYISGFDSAGRRDADIAQKATEG
jgi:hypothetical protein